MENAYALLRDRYAIDSSEHRALTRFVVEERKHERQLAELQEKSNSDTPPSRTELAFLLAQLDVLKSVVEVCMQIRESAPITEILPKLREFEQAMAEDILPRFELSMGGGSKQTDTARNETEAHAEALTALLDEIQRTSTEAGK